MGKLTHRWTKSASAKWEDAWLERLRFVGGENLAILSKPGSPLIKIQAFCDARNAKALERNFGGRSEKIPPFAPLPSPPGKPLSIRGKLKIFSDEAQWLARGGAMPPHILMPAGLAFGTGEHATTSTCLCMVCDVAGELPTGFKVVDAGTGSGILAIAAAKLGAQAVLAIDNDPEAVRTAKQNVRVNRAACVRVRKADVLNWCPPFAAHLVVANLFSGLLVSTTPKFRDWLLPNGWLVISGILAPQWEEVRAACLGTGFVEIRTVRKGRWVAATLQLGAPH